MPKCRVTPIVAFCIAEKRGWGASKIQSNPGLGLGRIRIRVRVRVRVRG